MWQRQTSQFLKRKLSELKNRLNSILLTGINEHDSSFTYCLGRESRKILLLPSFNSPLCPASSWVKGNAILQSCLCWRHCAPWMQGAEKIKPKKSQRKSKRSLSMVSHLRRSPILGLTNRVPQEQKESKSSSIQRECLKWCPWLSEAVSKCSHCSRGK